MTADQFSEVLRVVDEALAEEQEARRPPAPAREPDPVLTPIDVHIAELREAQVSHNAEIEAAQTRYADKVTASRAKLAEAQDRLRAAERELAARWHGESV